MRKCDKNPQFGQPGFNSGGSGPSTPTGGSSVYGSGSSNNKHNRINNMMKQEGRINVKASAAKPLLISTQHLIGAKAAGMRFGGGANSSGVGSGEGENEGDTTHDDDEDGVIINYF